MRSPVTSTLAAVLRSGRISLALALAAGALGLSACGDDEGGTIPPENADALLAEVETLEQSIEADQCSNAAASVARLQDQVDLLPKEVGEPTKDDLRDLTDNLQTLVASDCDEAQEAPDTTTTPGTGATGQGGSVPSDDSGPGGSEG
jgi:hypothetical protein